MIKCLVWDLDETLWQGTLLEGDALVLRPEVPALLAELDRRGVLCSIASRNEPSLARATLERLGVAEYFLYPQIGWGAKSTSIAEIARKLNIGIDSLGFIDDQAFERAEVQAAHPAVTVFSPEDLPTLLDRPALQPRFVTEDSSRRRRMMLDDQARAEAEERFEGPPDAFLASLNLIFTIAPAAREDLRRAEELTLRTNQLNTTGYTYSYEELDALRQRADHTLLVAGLEDRFGTYGKIGLALVHRGEAVWTIKLLLMSCRVMSRGVGALLLNHIRQEARAADVALHAEFVPTERNRMMYVTWRFAGFRELSQEGRLTLLRDEGDLPPSPATVDLRVAPWSREEAT